MKDGALEIAMGAWAVGTVARHEELAMHERKPGIKRKRGLSCRAAGGMSIPNESDNTTAVKTEEGKPEDDDPSGGGQESILVGGEDF